MNLLSLNWTPYNNRARRQKPNNKEKKAFVKASHFNNCQLSGGNQSPTNVSFVSSVSIFVFLIPSLSDSAKHVIQVWIHIHPSLTDIFSARIEERLLYLPGYMLIMSFIGIRMAQWQLPALWRDTSSFIRLWVQRPEHHIRNVFSNYYYVVTYW